MSKAQYLPAVGIVIIAATLGVVVWFKRGAETDTSLTQTGDPKKTQTKEDYANIGDVPPHFVPANEPSQTGKRRPWPAHLEQLREDFLKAADQGDLKAVRELAIRMNAESSGHLNGAVNSLITKTLQQLMAGKKEERHAPPAVLSNSEVRSLVLRFNNAQDPLERQRLVGELSRARIPNELLPDIVSIIEASLTNSPGDVVFLSLLNSFVGKESEAALVRFAQPPYSSGVRSAAISQLARRELTKSQLEAFSSQSKGEPDATVRAAWVKLLAKKHDRSLESNVFDSLSDSSAQVRASAIVGLNPSVESHREKLINILGDPSPIVRGDAIRQLSRNIQNERILAAIVSSAKADSAEQVRLKAVGSLNRPRFTNNREVLSILEGISINDPSEKVRSQAKKILFWFKRNP